MDRSYAPGDQLAPLVIGEITRELIAEYSRVANDMNPMHTDEELAQSAGYPTVFAQGMLGMGHLARHITGICGIGRVRRMKVRFKTMTWPGETITCRARVTEVKLEATASGTKQLVTCDIHTENQDGEPKVTGTAVFEAD